MTPTFRTVMLWTMRVILLITIAVPYLYLFSARETVKPDFSTEMTAMKSMFFIICGCSFMWLITGFPAAVSLILAGRLKHNAPAMILLVATIAYFLVFVCSYGQEYVHCHGGEWILLSLVPLCWMIPAWIVVVILNRRPGTTVSTPSSPAFWSSSTKKWYARRRYWMLALLAVLIYFCLIPSPLRVSPETTGYTTPLLPNGDVDYFGAYEKTYIRKLSPPEDNGQRLLIAACGPRILEQSPMMDAVPWEELPTHERSKKWFEEQWIPLCEHMYIDPYAKPRFLDSLEWYVFMRKKWKASSKEGESPNSEEWKQYDTLWNRLTAAPWTAEEQPDTARWLEERSPVLDLFGVAVRKPNFACYRWRDDTLIAILLPDVQAARGFSRDLRIRITERLGKGDVDGAWDDIMSMFYLSRKHYVHDPILVVNIVGLAIETMGWEAAKLVLQYGHPTPEQLERFANDLESLPRRMTLYSEFELGVTYVMLQHSEAFLPAVGWLTDNDNGNRFSTRNMKLLYYVLSYLPYDRNIAGKRITELRNIEGQITGDSAWYINRIVKKKADEEWDNIMRVKERQLSSALDLWRVPLIRTRSQLMADHLICLLTPAMWAADIVLDRAHTQFDMLRIAVALARYKSAEGSYPSDLEVLVPRFLEEVPLEPFTGRKTFMYKLTPDAETAVLLHSTEWDVTGEDNSKKNLYIRLP